MFAPMSESGSNGGIGFTMGIVAILVANVVSWFLLVYSLKFAYNLSAPSSLLLSSLVPRTRLTGSDVALHHPLFLT